MLKSLLLVVFNNNKRLNFEIFTVHQVINENFVFIINEYINTPNMSQIIINPVERILKNFWKDNLAQFLQLCLTQKKIDLTRTGFYDGFLNGTFIHGKGKLISVAQLKKLPKLQKNKDYEDNYKRLFKNCQILYWKHGRKVKKQKEKSYLEFTGYIINGRPNGFGALNRKTGNFEGTYKCLFINGLPVKGEKQFPVNSVKDGQAILPFRVYTGQFRGYEKWGYGCYQENGYVFVGSWRNNMMQGGMKLTIYGASDYYGIMKKDKWIGQVEVVCRQTKQNFKIDAEQLQFLV